MGDYQEVLQAYDPGSRLQDALLHQVGVGCARDPAISGQNPRLPPALDGPGEDGALEPLPRALLEPVEDGEGPVAEVLYPDLLRPGHALQPLHELWAEGEVAEVLVADSRDQDH